jgi:hypothetical protein
MANLYGTQFAGRMAPALGGLGADLRRDHLEEKRRSNDVRLQANHIRFACAVLFCSLSEMSAIGTFEMPAVW